MNSRLFTLALFGGLWIVLQWSGSTSFLRDPGTLWHTRCGEWMLEHREILQHDLYTFTFPGNTWYSPSWLGEVVMALLHRVGGLDALVLASSLLLAGVYSSLTSRYFFLGWHPLLGLALLGLILAASASHFHARTHLFTLLGLAILSQQLLRAESGQLTRLWALIPLFIVWGNFHGGVLAGVATIGLTLLGWLIAGVIGWPSPVRSYRHAIEVISLGLAVVLTLFINPFGSNLVLTSLNLAGMPELPRIIKEHAPMGWGDPSNWPFLACGGIYLLVLSGLREKPRITWLVPIVWLLLGIHRVRHGSLFCLLMLGTLWDIFPRTIWAQWLARNRPDYYQPNPEPGRWPIGGMVLCAGLILALGLILQSRQITAPLIGAGNAKLDQQLWPTELVPVMKEEAKSLIAPRLFNELNYGGFVIYFTPEYRHFVDDRCELFGGPWLERYILAEKSGTAEYLAQMQAQYGEFDFALTMIGSGFDHYFRDHRDTWEPIQATETVAFYRRK